MRIGLKIIAIGLAWASIFRLGAEKPHVEAEALTMEQAAVPGQELTVAFHFKMDPDWHIYWQNPGDSGLATKIEWNLPDGVKAGPIQWPVPERIIEGPLAAYGYNGETTLLASLKIPADFKARELKLQATASWLVCKETCVPGSATFSLSVPVQAQPGGVNATVAQWRQQTFWPTSTSGNLQANWQGHRLEIKFQSATPVAEAYFFAADNGVIDHLARQELTAGEWNRLIIPLAVNPVVPQGTLSGVLSLTQQNGAKTAWLVSVPLQEQKAAPLHESNIGFLTALTFAFVGGLILNLMPCVLPVLSLKVLGLVDEAKAERSQPWKHGLWFAAGVLVCFEILAGLLLGLRQAGHQLGWGFQLQSPQFAAALALLFWVMALNLWGVFEWSFGGISSLGLDYGWKASFSSGLLTTLVATPCTAPFMGTALGAAVTFPAWQALMIFGVMALGLSAPYLLLTIFPTHLKYVPRPGAWMIAFKQFLAFPLAATSLWLLWVLSFQAGSGAVIRVLSSALVLGLAAWMRGRWHAPGSSDRARIITTLLTLALVVFAFNLARVHEQKSQQPAGEIGRLRWEKYSAARLMELRQQHKIVFVDFTAAWCLSCQVNERVALESDEVVDAFQKKGVAVLKADWTSYDPAITQALASFGRNGVPLYLMYGSEPDPVILPSVLTPGLVIDALEKLK